MKKDQFIISVRVADHLLSKGHIIKRFDRSKKIEGRLIYVFDNSEKLQEDLQKYLKELRKEKSKEEGSK